MIMANFKRLRMERIKSYQERGILSIFVIISAWELMVKLDIHLICIVHRRGWVIWRCMERWGWLKVLQKLKV